MLTITNSKIINLATYFFVICNVLDYSGKIGVKYISFFILFLSLFTVIKKIKVNRSEIIFISTLLFFFVMSVLITLINDGDVLKAISYNFFIPTIILYLFLVKNIDKNKVLDFIMNFLFYCSLMIIMGNVFSNLYPVNSIINFLKFFAMNYDSYEGLRSSSMNIMPKIYFHFTLFLPSVLIYFLFSEKYLKSIFLITAIFLSLSRGAISISLFFVVLYFLKIQNFKQLIKKASILLILISLIIILIELFIPNIILHFFNIENTSEFSVSTRINQIIDVSNVFQDNFLSFIFGMGSGTPIYSKFLGQNIYNIEIAPLELLRKYGVIFVILIFGILFRIIIQNFNNNRRISFLLSSLLFATFTNPIITAPIFILIFFLCSNNNLKYNL
jgi:hypothetical protein